MVTKADILVVGSLLIVSTAGAYISKGIKDNSFAWQYSILSAIMSYTVWTLMLKFYNRPILLSSMLYDVGTIVFWFIALLVMGEKATVTNIAGAIIAALGVVLISL